MKKTGRNRIDAGDELRATGLEQNNANGISGCRPEHEVKILAYILSGIAGALALGVVGIYGGMLLVLVLSAEKDPLLAAAFWGSLGGYFGIVTGGFLGVRICRRFMRRST